MKQKRPYKITFKKWWWYLFPKRRKWLKVVNAEMAKPEIVSQINQTLTKSFKDLALYGTSVVYYEKDMPPRVIPPGEFFREHPEIKNILSEFHI